MLNYQRVCFVSFPFESSSIAHRIGSETAATLGRKTKAFPNSLLLKMTIEIVDLAIKHGDFPVRKL